MAVCSAAPAPTKGGKDEKKKEAKKEAPRPKVHLVLG